MVDEDDVEHLANAAVTMSSVGLQKPTSSSESEDDSDYIPSAEDSDGDDASDTENDAASDDAERAEPSAQKKRKRVKTKEGVSRKRRGGIRLGGEEEEDAALREDRISVADNSQKDEVAALAAEKEKNDELWADFLRDVGPRPKKDGAPAPSNAAEAEKPSSSKPNVQPEKSKVKVVQALEFAGETIMVEKEVAADSKEAKSFAALQRLQDGSSQEKTPALKDKKPIGALGVLNQLTNKKQKISTLEKSKLDWERYKQERGIGQELQTHNRGKDGYMEKQAFLERTDQRQFEIEKAIRAKNRTPRF